MISGLLSLAGAAILVVIDRLIKHWATAALLPVGSMDVLPGVEKIDTKIWRATMRIAFLRLPFPSKEDQIKNPF